MTETKRTLLKRIDVNVRALLSLFPASIRILLGDPVDRHIAPGRNQNVKLKDNQ